jgi:hypothetical protein
MFWHVVVAAGVAVWWCVWFLEGGPTSHVARAALGMHG